MATRQLTPEQLIAHQLTALAAAVSTRPLLGATGFVLVIFSAMKSTSSVINATLFGASRLAHEIVTVGALPRLFSFRNREGIPVYSRLLLGRTKPPPSLHSGRASRSPSSGRSRF